MYKFSIPPELKDLSGNALKQALLEHRKLQIIKLVCGQTNYTEEESKKLLEERNYEYLNIIKEYINPKEEITSKEEVKPVKSLNQQILGEIRTFMDDGYKQIQQRKKQEEYMKRMHHMRRMKEEQAIKDGNKKIS